MLLERQQTSEGTQSACQRHHIVPESGGLKESLINYHIGVKRRIVGVIGEHIQQGRESRTFKIVISKVAIGPQVLFERLLDIIKV